MWQCRFHRPGLSACAPACSFSEPVCFQMLQQPQGNALPLSLSCALASPSRCVGDASTRLQSSVTLDHAVTAGQNEHAALQAHGRERARKRIAVQPSLNTVYESRKGASRRLYRDAALAFHSPVPWPSTQKWCPWKWKGCCSCAVRLAPTPGR